MCMKNPQLGVRNQMDHKFTEIQSRSLGYLYLERYFLPFPFEMERQEIPYHLTCDFHVQFWLQEMDLLVTVNRK